MAKQRSTDRAEAEFTAAVRRDLESMPVTDASAVAAAVREEVDRAFERPVAERALVGSASS
ncbi:MAG: hypothetical protein ACRDYD_00210 [Acidimicrobiales bacterium]